MAKPNVKRWEGRVFEDGSFSVLARIVSLDGTGQIVKPREGRCLTIQDIGGVTAKVYSLGQDKNDPDPTPISPDPTLTPEDNFFNTLQINGWDTGVDPNGYNFRHDIDPMYVPNPDEWYLLEYKITLVEGGVIWLPVLVRTVGIVTS